jgi:hypothetical protein
MKRVFHLTIAIAALSMNAANTNAGSVALEHAGIAVQKAKVIFTFDFGQPYYRRHYYNQPYAPNRAPYQDCQLGIC